MEHVYLRSAQEADMDLLFEWANESVVRKNSFSTSNFTYEEHKQWYHKLLERKDSMQYICMCGEEAVGQIRIVMQADTAEIGYSVCVEKRGKGYGKLMLQLLTEKIKSDFPEIRKITGKVKKDNLISQKAFLRAGYEEIYRTFELNVVEEHAVYKNRYE